MVLQSRHSPCLPLVAIYLALAERTGVRAVPIATPRHVFIRETGVGSPHNVELLDHGATWPEARYLRQEEAPPEDARAKALLREISPKGLLAHLLDNHAVRLRAQGKTGEAEAVYRRALRLDPDRQPCQFNFANLLAAESKNTDAVRQYDRALALHPWDEEARRNRDLLKTTAR